MESQFESKEHRHFSEDPAVFLKRMDLPENLLDLAIDISNHLPAISIELEEVVGMAERDNL